MTFRCNSQFNVNNIYDALNGIYGVPPKSRSLGNKNYEFTYPNKKWSFLVLARANAESTSSYDLAILDLPSLN